jgi:predicted metal-dependent phosphoesterase TrpH
VHSKYSKDSLNEPKDIIKAAKKIGLGGVAVVDHGTIKGGKATSELNKDRDFIVITGAEIKTDRGEIIGYFLNEEIKSRGFMETVDEMRSQDALITIPHPFDTFRMNRLKDPEGVAPIVDSIEVFNSRCIFESYNKNALQLQRKNNLSATAGSDAHYIEELGSAGVYISGEDVRDELKKNQDYFGNRNPLSFRAKTSIHKLISKRA